MIQFTKVCQYCGEEYWGKHECEGTIRAAKERAAMIEAKNQASLAAIETFQSYLADSYLADSYECDEPKEVVDSVNHPKHYTSHPAGIECIDVTKHYNFQIGNAMKYLWRQGLKSESGLDPVEKQIQDCEKALWYISSFIEDLKRLK